jgi:alpha-D-xyloside xylohydrolase
MRVRIHLPNTKVLDYQQGDGLLPGQPKSDEQEVLAATAITNGNIRIELSSGGLATVTRVSDGKVLLSETGFALSSPQAQPANVSPTSIGSIAFQGLDSDEFVYGLGEHRGSNRCTNQCTNATLPIRSWDWSIQDSQDVSVLPNNGNAWIPFYSSSKGYAFLWNHAGYGNIHISPDAIRWTANATKQLDYWVTTTSAGDPDNEAVRPPYRDLLKHYIAATGAPPTLPHQYTGFWQCKLRYSSQAQVLRIAAEYVKRQLPLSVIVIDFHHWAHEGDWRFCDDADVPSNERCQGGCWPNPAAMASDLMRMNVTCAVSVWPDVDTKSINYVNMSNPHDGMLIRGESGSPLVSAQGKFYLDAFNPDTRHYVFDQFVRGYGRHGIDTFWMDATEPQGANVGKWYYKLDDGTLHRDAEVGMAWVQQYHRMAHEGLSKTSSGSVPPFLTRSAFAGSQRYGAILWSGDIESTFDELATQVQVAQHVAMSGIYLWTTDIGGFREGNTEDPVFRELIVRWFQFGAFCPIFRLHGSRGGPKDEDTCGSSGFNEVWHFGEEAYEAISGIMRLRESMRGYVQTQLDLASAEGTPALRPMTFDFSDAECVKAADQFMFGPSYLVAPVLYYKVSNRSVYLPTLASNEHWEYFYDPGQQFAAGSWHVVPTANLSAFPLFVRKASAQVVV